MIGKVIAYGDTRDTAIDGCATLWPRWWSRESRRTFLCTRKFSITPHFVRAVPIFTIWSGAWDSSEGRGVAGP